MNINDVPNTPLGMTLLLSGAIPAIAFILMAAISAVRFKAGRPR